ncbi:MAG: hypothetical protein RL607_246 [Bacteroidota bacterium]|jgi:hypothetical protein
MKRLVYFFVLLGSMAHAQISISLEHSYVVNANINNEGYGSAYPFPTQQGLYYYTREYVANTTKVKIYNQNHVFHKELVFNGLIAFKLISDKLFNDDDLIEFLYVDGIHTKLMNEDGQILYTWNDRWDPMIMKDNNNNFKLILYNRGITTIATTDIYALSGSLSLAQQEYYLNKSFIAYPNPAQESIEISNGNVVGEDTMLEVFTTQGMKVFEKKIVKGTTIITLDTSSLRSGMYIYKINGESHSFLKK